ncbi:hypothetical protein JCM1840_005256 [Sporobolomyces johnsonii]
MLRSTCSRCLSTAIPRQIPTPHPALSLTPSFLSADEQSLLLHHSLALLDSPSRTSSAARKRRRTWLKANPTWAPDSDRLRPFMDDEAYEFEQGHFDGVIRGYREMLVRDGLWDQVAKDDAATTELARVLERVYSLLPPPSSSPSAPSQASSPLSPPPHLIMHLLHLSSTGSIQPHVDNLDAFGRTIVGVSLGGERIMRFKQVTDTPEGTAQGPAEFEVLVESGSAYVQQEPLRTHYTHEVLECGSWEGRRVGGTQRLSIMLRLTMLSLPLIATTALLTSLAAAAPLPAPAPPSCTIDPNYNNGINVGAGIGIGNNGYGNGPNNGGYGYGNGGLKVKQGNQGACPQGWTRSLFQVDLCIEIGGVDHSREGGYSSSSTSHSTSHYASPTGVNRVAAHTTSTTSHHRSSSTSHSHSATHTSSHYRSHSEDDSGTFTPHPIKIGGTRQTTTTTSHSSSSSTPRPSGKKCPSGQTLGTGDLVDVCVDIDTNPLFVGGGIKIGGLGNDNVRPTTSSASRTSTSTSSRSTPTAGKKCPEGQALGSGDLLDLCVDVDTNPLFVGGGIKIGGLGNGNGRSTSTTSTRSPERTSTTSSRDPQRTSGGIVRIGNGNGNNDNGNGDRNNGRSTTTSSTSSRSTPTGTKCPSGQTLGTGDLVDVCVDIDTNPLFVGGGIKIGGLGNGNGRSTSTTSTRSPERTSTTSTRSSQPTSTTSSRQPQSTPSNSNGNLPPCSGPADPLALLDLCVQVGNLVGAKVKIGGTSAPSSSATSTTSSHAPSRTPAGTIRIGNNGNNNNGNGNNGNGNGNNPNNNGGNNGNNKNLPPCNGKNDPNAALNLCVVVGSNSDPLLSTSATVGGSNGNSNDNGGLLNLGGLLNAKVAVGAGSGSSSSSSRASTTTSTHASTATPIAKVTYHQSAPIKTGNQNNNNNNGNNNNNNRNPSSSSSASQPLISANVKVNLNDGPSSSSTQQRRPSPSPSPSAASAGSQKCPVGQILHLGVCISADVNVPGVVHATAAATAAV